MINICMHEVIFLEQVQVHSQTARKAQGSLVHPLPAPAGAASPGVRIPQHSGPCGTVAEPTLTHRSSRSLGVVQPMGLDKQPAV